MEQKLTTLVQQKWISKMLVFDYTIQYKKGKENLVADVLSRKHEMEHNCVVVIEAIPSWRTEVRDSLKDDNEAQELIAQLLLLAFLSTNYKVKF